MKLPELGVKRPVTTLMLFLFIFLFGIVTYNRLQVDVLPDIEMPMLTVMTIYPGASALEVEEQISKELEEELSSVPDLKSVKSTSKENVSFVSLEFNWGADLTEATNDTRDKIELRKRYLPDDAQDPIIVKINSAMMPILMYSIEADKSFPELDEIIEKKITNRLKKLKGVGTVMAFGQPEKQINIELDPYRMKAYGLSVNIIKMILEMSNITIPGGNIKTGSQDLSIRVPGEFETIKEVENTVISSINGKIIRIRDIAQVERGFKEKDEIIMTNGKKCVEIMVQKQSGANTLEVSDRIKNEIEKIKAGLPQDVVITQSNDASQLVTHSISNLKETIFWAALFVIIVVIFFLRDLKSSLIIILTIPFSLIGAFIWMFLMDYSINIFSLMSLIIAIGMVVDNSIVVLENTTKYLEKGVRPGEAAIFGAGEMGMAIGASTLTTVVVFLPLVFLGGIVGILFKQLAILTSVTLIISLFTALTLTPMLSSFFLKLPPQGEKIKHGKIFQLSERFFVFMEETYSKILKWVLKHRKTFILSSLALFIITLIVAASTGSDYIPEFDAGDVSIVAELEQGVKVEETQKISQEIVSIFNEELQKLGSKEDLSSLFSVSGQTERGAFSLMGFSEGKNITNIMAKLVISDERNFTSKELAANISERLKDIPELVKYHVSGGSLLGAALQGSAKPIELKLMGFDLDELNRTAQKLETLLKDNAALSNIESTIDEGKLELNVRINREKAGQMGIKPAQVALAVRQCVYGAEAGEFSEDGEKHDIKVRFSPRFRKNIRFLNDIMIMNSAGRQVPLSSVAEITEEKGPLQILHESQQRVVYVKLSLAEGYSLGEAVETVKKDLENFPVPSEVGLTMGGQFEDQQESFGDLKLLFILGIILVFMVMASQFESIKHPFIIIFAIPLSIIGVVWAFVLTGTSLSVTSFIGVIMLLGIVVNNGIVLVDYTNLLKARGHDIMESALQAGRSRLRPVLMTAFTTLFAMVPMAMSSGLGSEMWSPIGITVIGGLLVSTLITLLLIPVIYVSIHPKERKKLKKG